MFPLPQRSTRPDTLFITSSRAQPEPAVPRYDNKPNQDELQRHLTVDPRAPFHYWLDSQGLHAPQEVRPWTDVVIPDGVGRGIDLVAPRLLVLCVSGWYWDGAYGLVGSLRLPASTVQHLRTWISAGGFPYGPWDFGSPMAGKPIENFVRELRGDPCPEGPENRYFVASLRPLNTPQDVRRALRESGFSPDSRDAHGSWTVKDQLALTLFQDREGLPATGWPDLTTCAALRQRAATTHANPLGPVQPVVDESHPSFEAARAHLGRLLGTVDGQR